ncbi:Hypoxanthine-guanine phosphoribosyltransferase [hydrothermal vent metagenome]|uniref:Hypoxanthine-guanine phosphoribosyltransferase n=1 Tax=hydrothermal vent metagenome TaxID=652676 RepID=A0A3B1DJ75_9ZZZZ
MLCGRIGYPLGMNAPPRDPHDPMAAKAQPPFPEIERTLYTREAIAGRVHELAAMLCEDLRAELGGDKACRAEVGKIVIMPIMSGAMVFAADLLREMPLKLSLGLVAVSSYPGKSLASKGAVISSELPSDLGGKHVVIVDDILDSGQTIELVRQIVGEQKPASVRACVMLRKDVPRVAKMPDDQLAEYVGFDIPDEFVVGYGLDYNGYYRNHPEIVTLKREAL